MAKKIKLGLLGSSGKMGFAIRQLLESDDRFLSFLEISKKPTKTFTSSYADLKKVPTSILNQVDVWIDFSQPEGLVSLLPIAIKTKKPIVSGTTGLTKDQLTKLKNSGKVIATFWESNMSVGLWTLRQAIKTLSPISYFDFALEEIHHIHKKDNPSGTAVTLHHDLEQAVGKKIAPAVGYRMGGVYGIHTITAASQSEMIKIEHNALNRTVFAEGALRAALWIVKQPTGLYSMDDLMQNVTHKKRK